MVDASILKKLKRPFVQISCVQIAGSSFPNVTSAISHIVGNILITGAVIQDPPVSSVRFVITNSL